MNDDLSKLIEKARQVTITPEAEREHRRSFVYGNTHIENERITRKLVDEVDAEIETAGGGSAKRTG